MNTLLRLESPVPFEFLINGQFLRTSIEEYLTENGISAETTLAVEYVRAIVPPLYLASFEHDDWVSSVDVLSGIAQGTTIVDASDPSRGPEGQILSGSYDGLLRIWNSASQLLGTSPGSGEGGHTSAIKAARFLSSTQIASAGIDRLIRIWRLSQDAEAANMRPKLELYGHKGPIENIDIHEPTLRVISASADRSVGLWSARKSEGPEAPATLIPSAQARGTKRRKVGSAVSLPQRGPLSLLKSHNAPVSSACFAPNDHTIGYSTSWDHSLKTWDLTTSTCVETRSTSHPLLSLTSLPSLSLLAAGTSARHITLIDPRANATTVSAMTLRGHSNAVVSLATDPEGPYGLLSGSHDGTCRVWDVRSSKSDKDGRVSESVYCIERESAKGQGRQTAGEGLKVFGVSWHKEIGIVSAGEDRRVQINRGQGMIGEKVS